MLHGFWVRQCGGAIAAGVLWLASAIAVTAQEDPRISSWFMEDSGRYARLFETDADLAAGNSKTTWSRNSVTQALPAYSGVQMVLSSTNWIYIRTSGMGFHVMGPWYLNAARSQLFPNLPSNRKAYYQLPRTNAVPVTRTLTGLGAIGYFVDGVAMFDSRDGYFWNGTAETNGNGTGYWNREAYVNEGLTFDPANAHQEQTGTYHYHANPIALRYLIGDHVTFTNGFYSESAATPTNHSPILGWVRDGAPIYGPYGYVNATNPASGVRRMRSGYALRNGLNGTDVYTNRTTIPAWAMRAYGVAAAQSGPQVSVNRPLGRYMEDNAYRGDLGATNGIDFDLDEYNGRYCVTPEYPQGIYAYFVAITTNGAPAYPYNIGRRFYGTPTGAAVSNITEFVTTNFVGGADTPPQFADPQANLLNETITLTWSAAEGGRYTVTRSTNLSAWVNAATNVAPTGTVAHVNVPLTNAVGFYRVARATIAAYDPVTNASAGGIISIQPSVGTAGGAPVSTTITLDPNANPAVPPQQAPVMSATIGTTAATGTPTRPTQYTISATFSIPAGTAPGAKTVTVVFPGPPENPTDTRTYTLQNGFTVQ